MSDNLPSGDWQYPTCGACGSETDHDGDSFVCEDCGLAFDQKTLSAEYLDFDVSRCGAACTNTWHKPDAIKPGMTFVCGTCALPEGHKSDHWTGCRAEARR